MSQEREPDCVFNVWGDGLAMKSEWATRDDAWFVRTCINQDNPMPWRITYRIRVFMKPGK